MTGFLAQPRPPGASYETISERSRRDLVLIDIFRGLERKQNQSITKTFVSVVGPANVPACVPRAALQPLGAASSRARALAGSGGVPRHVLDGRLDLRPCPRGGTFKKGYY